MRRAPLLLAALFLAITLARVAAFTGETMGAGAIPGWLFAVGLGAGVFTAAFWLKVNGNGLRNSAFVCLLLFVGVDLVFNLTEVYRFMDKAGEWERFKWQGALYGSFPTLAVFSLGWLSGWISKLPPTPAKKGSVIQRFRAGLFVWLDGQLPSEQPQATLLASQSTLSVTKSLPEAKYHCLCGYASNNRYQYAGHKGKCRKSLSNNDVR